MPVYSGSVFFTVLPTDWQGGFPVTPDAHRALGVRGGLLLAKIGETDGPRYDDVPNVYQRDGIRHPRFPVGGTFSPDGKFLFWYHGHPAAGLGRHGLAGLSSVRQYGHAAGHGHGKARLAASR